jgi:hypothetical protein
MVARLPRKHKACSSNPNTTKKKKRGRELIIKIWLSSYDKNIINNIAPSQHRTEIHNIKYK